MNNQPAPGWYHAEGDPSDTQRYWDGSQWHGDPHAVSSAASIPPPAAADRAPLAGPQAAVAKKGRYLQKSEAINALLTVVIGFFCCNLLLPVGWYRANKELEAIDAGTRDPSKRGFAQAAQALGILGTVLWVLAVIFVLASTVIGVRSEQGG